MALEDPRMSMAAMRALQMRCTFCSTLFSTTNRCTVVSRVCMQQPGTHGHVVQGHPFLTHTTILLKPGCAATMSTSWIGPTRNAPIQHRSCWRK